MSEQLESAANALANAAENLLQPCEACDGDNKYVPCTCTDYPYQLQRLALAVERFRNEQYARDKEAENAIPAKD